MFVLSGYYIVDMHGKYHLQVYVNKYNVLVTSRITDSSKCKFAIFTKKSENKYFLFIYKEKVDSAISTEDKGKLL